MRKYRAKHFSCCNLFILYFLRLSPSTRYSLFIRHSKCQVIFSFRLMSGTLSLLQNPGINIFRTECLPCHPSTNSCVCDLFPFFFFFFWVVCFELPDIYCLVKFFVVDNAYGIFAFFKLFLASSFCWRNFLKPSKLTFLFCCSWMYILKR